LVWGRPGSSCARDLRQRRRVEPRHQSTSVVDSWVSAVRGILLRSESTRPSMRAPQWSDPAITWEITRKRHAKHTAQECGYAGARSRRWAARSAARRILGSMRRDDHLHWVAACGRRVRASRLASRACALRCCCRPSIPREYEYPGEGPNAGGLARVWACACVSQLRWRRLEGV